MSVDTNDNLELHYSKALSIFALLCAIGVIATSGVAMLGLTLAQGWRPIGALGLLILVPIVWIICHYAIRGLLRTTPVVVFDANGVTDTRKHSSFIPWSDISHISLGSGDGSHYLRFQFRSPEIAQHHVRSHSIARVLLTRLTGLRDWNINLMSLRCSRLDVLRTAKRLHQRSVATEIRSINQDGGRDLFVVDRRD
jgi:hypothetical protein